MLEMKNKYENENFWYEGGHGISIKDALIIRGTKNPVLGVFAEKHFISSRFGQEGSDWFFDSQELFLVESEAFDLITFWLSDGSLEQVYFNVSEFYGKGIE